MPYTTPCTIRPVHRLPDHLGVYYEWRSFHWGVHQEVAGLITDHTHESIDVEVVADAYQQRLAAEVQPGLKATTAQTNRRRGDETGGPGITFDLVSLAVGATAVAGAYVIWKEVAADIRETVRRLRRIGNHHHVVVDEGAALILAVDAVAAPDTFADLRLRFIAELHGEVAWDRGPARGYLVALEQGGATTFVVIDPDGKVIGRSDDVTDIDFGQLGV